MRNLWQFRVTFATDYSELVKMISEPKKWPAFASYLDDTKNPQASFLSSKIIYVPRMQNLKTDCLAQIVRKQMSFVVHMDAELQVWFT